MDEILRKPDVVELLGISPRTLDYLIASGLVPHTRLNPTPGGKGHRTIRFSKKRILEWIQSGKAPSSVYNECGSTRAEATG